MNAADIKQIAADLAAEQDADVLLVNTSMDRGKETLFIDRCARLVRRKNALVIIVTNGGDADVAYRMARCLQQRYEKVTAIISGACKSAGTLLAIGAHELAFSDHGELGPLDVQLRKSDDMWSSISGLTVMNAITALQTKSEEAFADFVLSIKARSDGSVTFKTAAEIATKLTVGLFSHVYQQIEVMHVGEAARASNIAKEYGQRLNRVSGNLKGDDSLSTLVASYPSHSFVIDRKEAETLFKQVRAMTDKELQLCAAIGTLSRRQVNDDEFEPILYLSHPPAPATPVNDAEEKANDTHQADRRNTAGEKTGTEAAANEAAPAPETPASAQVLQLPTAAGASGG